MAVAQFHNLSRPQRENSFSIYFLLLKRSQRKIYFAFISSIYLTFIETRSWTRFSVVHTLILSHMQIFYRCVLYK